MSTAPSPFPRVFCIAIFGGVNAFVPGAFPPLSDPPLVPQPASTSASAPTPAAIVDLLICSSLSLGGAVPRVLVVGEPAHVTAVEAERDPVATREPVGVATVVLDDRGQPGA